MMIYYGELDRFGYTFTAVGTDKDVVRDAITNEYVKTYMEVNGIDPREDVGANGETYYDVMLEDLYIEAYAPGEVHWR